MKKRRKGWYKKARKKWLRDRVTEYFISSGHSDIKYVKGVTIKLNYYYSCNNIIQYIWNIGGYEDKFWYAWRNRTTEFDSGRLKVRYTCGINYSKL